ncbi:tubby-like F-box protein 2 [Neltuma alba]|uniref:tubby-like F-box protein 2 n=1 Tax=Neltuma alba TaxID=207710 RepID=UPI0010A475D1|nr:tubby-like F-box protein 2 [Prosopis alba]XP_028760370.1 tubby-like F-box protein 2 [Prosopis alba]
MSWKIMVRELKEMRDGMSNMSKRGAEYKQWHSRKAKSHIAPDVTLPPVDPIQQGQWANLPPELLLDIIRRVEESETTWPARAVVVSCASVCKSWRAITKEIVKTPEQCGRLTFPVSVKQPGPRDASIQCFIRRNRETSTYYLYFGLVPTENERAKLLLAAKRIRKPTATEFVISFIADDFSRASSTYLGKLRSNFLGTKFAIRDSQPSEKASIEVNNHSSSKFPSKQASPGVAARKYNAGTINYELNVLRTRGPRRMHCILNSIPMSAIQEGGNAPTPTTLPQFSFSPALKGKDSNTELSSANLLDPLASSQGSADPLVLKNKAPRWHEQLQCWCLNFKGRVTVASVKNFQLCAAVDPSHDVPAAEQEKVILQFGKIGKDIFTMDYRYPLSAFQAFAICLSSFDTKPACE